MVIIFGGVIFWRYRQKLHFRIDGLNLKLFNVILNIFDVILKLHHQFNFGSVVTMVVSPQGLEQILLCSDGDSIVKQCNKFFLTLQTPTVLL